MNTGNNSNTRIWIGLALILFGVFLFLENYVNLPFYIPYQYRRWEWILIIIGVIITLTSQNKKGGFILISIGILFTFGFKALWPLLLIGLGIHFLFRRGLSQQTAERKQPDGSPNPEFNNMGNPDLDFIDDVTAFGGGTKKIHSQNFRGGKITNLFGGSEINLLEARLAKGTNVIDIVAVFGGSTFYAPSDWNIMIELVPIFGGFSDRRIKDPSLVPDPERTLIFKGFILFGGGEIKTIK